MPLLVLVSIVTLLLGLYFLLHSLCLCPVALPRTYAEGWHTVATAPQSQVEDLLEATTLVGQPDSWLWIVVVLVMSALGSLGARNLPVNRAARVLCKGFLKRIRVFDTPPLRCLKVHASRTGIASCVASALARRGARCVKRCCP
ncbi:hypothetical protein IW252_001667 [Zhihengliuella flava]|uniref:Uncharacterized protein n=1 Tax=Zhihengliuella flava TaxID=1285193 RepID=A0A931DDQ0_9MICC|nr:hypothetical protein [Zhihengliuella flava]